jgi:hypothetical protein
VGLANYIVGFATLLATVVCSVVAGAAVVRRRLGALRGATRWAALGLTITAALIAAHVVPGAIGLLYPGVVALCAAAIAAGCLLLPYAAGPPGVEPRSGSEPLLSRAIALVSVAAGAVGCLGYLRLQGDRVPESIDALSFHLPDVARWAQQHGFWQIHQFVPDLAHGNYPNNGDVLSLVAVLPFHDLSLVRWVFVPWLALTGIGVAALARELGAPRTSARVFGAVAATLPVVLRSALPADLPDVVLYSTFTAGLVFLVRHRRSGERSELMLAGLGLGLALGTKWYGLSAFALVLALWAAARVLERAAARRLLADGALLCGVALLAGGFWLLRNLVLSGNPLFPVRVSVAGVTLFDAPYDVVRAKGGFTLAHYAGNGSVWRTYIWPAFKDSYGAAPIVLGAGALLAIWLGRARRELAALLVLAIGLAAVYAITPYSAQGPDGLPVQVAANTRYGVPALLVAAALCAVAAGRLGRARWLGELLGLLLVLDGLRRGLHVPGHTVATTIPVLLALACLYGVGRLGWRTRLLAPLVAAIAVVAIFGVARRLDTHLDHTAWRADPALAWIADHANGGRRIGLGGVWPPGGVAPVLPAFGGRLDNRVVYIGPFVDHMLRQYTSAGRFVARVRREHIALLLLGRGYPTARASTREETWAHAAGMRLVVRSPRFTLWAY